MTRLERAKAAGKKTLLDAVDCCPFCKKNVKKGTLKKHQTRSQKCRAIAKKKELRALIANELAAFAAQLDIMPRETGNVD